MATSDDRSSENETLIGLFEAARRGDRGAQEALLASELPRLRAFVRLRAGAALRARESASDLVQSVCRELLKELGTIDFRGSAAFRSWLYRAAEHKIIDRARRLRAKRRAGPVPADAELGKTYFTLLTPSRHAIAREDVSRVEAAFDELTQDYREVITLAKIMGLPHSEIAERMDRSEGAVRVLLFRALATLVERMEPRRPG